MGTSCRVSIHTLGHGSQTSLCISGVEEEKVMYVYAELYWSQCSNLLEGWLHYRYNVDAKFWLMNLTERGFWCVCTLISNLDMQNKIIFQILPVPQLSFQFLPGNYTELQWHPVATRHRHRKTSVARHKKKKISASLCHLLISNSNLPQLQHPQSRWVPSTARAAGMGGWEQPEHCALSLHPCFLARIKPPTDRRAI